MCEIETKLEFETIFDKGLFDRPITVKPLGNTTSLGLDGRSIAKLCLNVEHGDFGNLIHLGEDGEEACLVTYFTGGKPYRAFIVKPKELANPLSPYHVIIEEVESSAT